MLTDGPLPPKEPNPKEQKEKKSTMPVLFPLSIYTVDGKPRSHKVENRYDKTWLEKRPGAPMVPYTKSNTRGGNT